MNTFCDSIGLKLLDLTLDSWDSQSEFNMDWKIFKHVFWSIALAPLKRFAFCLCLHWILNLRSTSNLGLGFAWLLVIGNEIRTLAYWHVHSCLYSNLYIINGRRSLDLRILLLTLRSTSYSRKVIGAVFFIFFNFWIIRTCRIRSKFDPNSGLTPKNLSPKNFFKSRIVDNLISVLVHFEPQYGFECFAFV